MEFLKPSSGHWEPICLLESTVEWRLRDWAHCQAQHGIAMSLAREHMEGARVCSCDLWAHGGSILCSCDLRKAPSVSFYSPLRYSVSTCVQLRSSSRSLSQWVSKGSVSPVTVETAVSGTNSLLHFLYTLCALCPRGKSHGKSNANRFFRKHCSFFTQVHFTEFFLKFFRITLTSISDPQTQSSLTLTPKGHLGGTFFLWQ